MTIKVCLAGSCALVLSSGALADQTATFMWLDQAFSAMDMTPDGRIVVGGGAGGAYLWTQEEGYTFIGGIQASAVSDDGSVVFGAIDDPKNPGHNVAARWTADAGWVSLGGLRGGGLCPSVSSAYELSADGSVCVGLGWYDVCDAAAFRWTEETGMVAMDVLANGGNRASVVSADGQLLGGFAQGSFSRTPAIWHADGTGELLDPPNGDVLGEVQGISDDGSILLGDWDGDAFYRTEEDGVVTFPTVILTYKGTALDIDDAGTIVGFDVLGLSRVAWIKPAGEDAERLIFWLNDLGADVPSSLEVAQAISRNGRVIIGHNAFGGGWIVHLSKNSDIDGDGMVGFTDLLIVLAAWGPCGEDPCPADLNEDGEVGFVDLLTVLADWG